MYSEVNNHVANFITFVGVRGRKSPTAVAQSVGSHKLRLSMPLKLKNKGLIDKIYVQDIINEIRLVQLL